MVIVPLKISFWIEIVLVEHLSIIEILLMIVLDARIIIST